MRLMSNRLANGQIVEKLDVSEPTVASLAVALAQSQPVEAGLVAARRWFAATTSRVLAWSIIGRPCIRKATAATVVLAGIDKVHNIWVSRSHVARAAA